MTNNNGTSFLLVGAFIIAGTLGSNESRGPEYISAIYGTSSKVQVEQNAKVNPLNTNDKQQTPEQGAILVNQQTGDPTQPIIYHQASNQQAVFISEQQNQNQPTLFLSNQPQQVRVSQPPSQQSILINQPANQPATNLLYIQKPNEQQTIWVTAQPNQQPNQVFVNQPSNVPNQPVVFATSQPVLLQKQPDTIHVIANQPSNNQPVVVQPQNQQSYLFISSQSNQQPVKINELPTQQGTGQVINKPVVIEKPTQQPTIWIASQPNQPTLLINQQPNQPSTGQTNLPTVMNVGQPTLNQGNFLLVPVNGNVNPNGQQGNAYYVTNQQGTPNPVYTLSGRK